MAQEPMWIKVASLSRIHDHTQKNTHTYSVRLLWISDQLDAETST